MGAANVLYLLGSRLRTLLTWEPLTYFTYLGAAYVLYLLCSRLRTLLTWEPLTYFTYLGAAYVLYLLGRSRVVRRMRQSMFSSWIGQHAVSILTSLKLKFTHWYLTRRLGASSKAGCSTFFLLAPITTSVGGKSCSGGWKTCPSQFRCRLQIVLINGVPFW